MKHEDHLEPTHIDQIRGRKKQMLLKRLQNKLLKNGYLPEIQEETHERWIDVRHSGKPISFIKWENNDVNALRVHNIGSEESESLSSVYTSSAAEAIRLSRASR